VQGRFIPTGTCGHVGVCAGMRGYGRVWRRRDAHSVQMGFDEALERCSAQPVAVRDQWLRGMCNVRLS
jgi:hypothetical protein